MRDEMRMRMRMRVEILNSFSEMNSLTHQSSSSRPTVSTDLSFKNFIDISEETLT